MHTVRVMRGLACIYHTLQPGIWDSIHRRKDRKKRGSFEIISAAVKDQNIRSCARPLSVSLHSGSLPYFAQYFDIDLRIHHPSIVKMAPLTKSLSTEGIITIAIGVPSLCIAVLSLWVACATLLYSKNRRDQVLQHPHLIHLVHHLVLPSYREYLPGT